MKELMCLCSTLLSVLMSVCTIAVGLIVVNFLNEILKCSFKARKRNSRFDITNELIFGILIQE